MARFFILLALILAASNCFAAGSSTSVTYDDGADGVGHGNIRKVLIDFVTDDTTGAVSVAIRKISGTLLKVVTDPGATAPTDDWDVTIVDPEGLSVVAGCQNSALLIARDTANTEQTYLQLLNADMTPIGIAAYPVVCDVLTIGVANAGNSKTGQIILYYKPN